MIMTSGMPFQYTGGSLPGHDDTATMMYHPPDATPPGTSYIHSGGMDAQYGPFAYSQPPPLGYSMVPMIVPVQRIAPRELPPFVHWKDKRKNREDGARDSAQGRPSLGDCKQQEEGNSVDLMDLSHRPPKHGSHTRRNTGDVCKFFIQHGSCAYGNTCKFQHPLDMAPLVHFNRFGLPRRPGSDVCKYFLKTGRCSYGHTCKFDHPEVVSYQYNQNSQHHYQPHRM